jgi:hypothetical protein
MIKITITVDTTLDEARRLYNAFHGYKKGSRVTRKDMAEWFALIVRGELESIEDEEID